MNRARFSNGVGHFPGYSFKLAGSAGDGERRFERFGELDALSGNDAAIGEIYDKRTEEVSIRIKLRALT